MTARNRHRKLNFLEIPLPLREGIKGRGNHLGYSSPSPSPSPVKGEGTLGHLYLYFSDDRTKLSNSFTIKNSFLKLTAIKSKTLKFGMFFAISIQRRYNVTGNYNA
jgi:hypothetical protein